MFYCIRFSIFSNIQIKTKKIHALDLCSERVSLKNSIYTKAITGPIVTLRGDNPTLFIFTNLIVYIVHISGTNPQSMFVRKSGIFKGNVSDI